jgi:hypothetical protein
VTKDVPPGAIVVGNPARIVGFVDVKRGKNETSESHRHLPGVHSQRMKHDVDLPFAARRCFAVQDLGDNAWCDNEATERFAVCVKGGATLVVDDGSKTEEIPLRPGGGGVRVGAALRMTIYQCSPDALVLVFAAHPPAEKK